MPFVYEIRIAEGEPPREFVQRLVPEGSLVGTGQAVGTLTDGAMEWHVPAPRQGLLVAWMVEHGDEAEAGDVLCRVVSEGESEAVDDAVPTRLG